MSEKISHGTWAAIFSLAFVGVAHAQHNFQLTKTVVKAGGGDFTTIQAAINILGIPAVGGTVLIYAGTYPENVTLGTSDFNIDLIGMDRESVIIAPLSGDGILITSGLDTSRNNSIRNLTIKTADGHGIEIVKGGLTVPKDIVIEGVTIEAGGPDKDGIYACPAENLRIAGCAVSSDDGDGIALSGPSENDPKPKKVTVGRTIVNRDRATRARDPTVENSVHPSSPGNVHIINCQVTSRNGLAIHLGQNLRMRDTVSTDGGSARSWAQSTGQDGVWIPYCKITGR